MSWKQGQVAEERVAQILLRQGFRILTRNHRSRGSEIDLLVWREKRLLLIEVKGRKDCEDPSSLLSLRKLQCLLRGLEHWLELHPYVDYASIEAWLCCVPSDKNRAVLWYDLSGWIEQVDIEMRKAFFP